MDIRSLKNNSSNDVKKGSSSSSMNHLFGYIGIGHVKTIAFMNTSILKLFLYVCFLVIFHIFVQCSSFADCYQRIKIHFKITGMHKSEFKKKITEFAWKKNNQSCNKRKRQRIKICESILRVYVSVEIVHEQCFIGST